ncbi:MAG: helix-turn-helix transcriptional regulator [Deferribacterales bacterium]
MYNLKRKELLNLINYFEKLINIRSYSRFCEAMMDIKGLFPFEFVHVGSVSFSEDWSAQTFYTNVSIMNNWSLFKYTAYSEGDPVCNMVSAGKGLVWWEQVPDVINDMVNGMAGDFMSGYTCSRVSSDKSKTALISFGGSQFVQTERTEQIIKLLCPHVSEAFFKLYDMKDTALEILSEKELRVLRWLKSGKTSWEISTILEISENTVNFHIKNIKRKLNASNRQHAVAIALAHNLIT